MAAHDSLHISVRSTSKGTYFQRLFETDGFGKDRFSFVIVDDIEKEGAFDEAVVGVGAVEHTASPVTLNYSGDPQGQRSRIGIKRHAPGVKRVVITSSYAAIVTLKTPSPGQEFETIDEAKGENAGSTHIYRASKAPPGQAAWDFVDKNKGSIGFDLATSYGIHEVTSALGASLELFRNNVLLGSNTEEELVTPVNQSGRVHVLLLANPHAGGERFITASGPDSWQNFPDIIHRSQLDPADAPKGYPRKGHNPKVPARVLATKAENLLGFKFRRAEDTVPETFRYIREKGL
ncbi:methylglyoxal reductase (NADPH-dependent) gre2 [Tulasnella sp. JGI-2019a]|nr:methylglyoxal reductase (NADPH-dependent) gre2 [Tulasnella sp. JGI-2019a]